MKARTLNLLLLALLLLCASAAIYLPWQDNPLVFDDSGILKSPVLGDYAQAPFSLQPRQFPYFTLGFESVVSNGDLHVSRYVNVVLHALNGFLLFLLSQRLLRHTLQPQRALVTAVAVSLIFVVHPVAVYAVGYLVQRTILFATFFLLLSVFQFDKALAARSWSRAVFAGLCFGAAVFSKEHAVTGFVGVLGVVMLNRPFTLRSHARALFPFLAVALPCVLWVVSLQLGLVASAYEPDAHYLISAVGFPDAGSRLGNWMLSIALQCAFFFRYLYLWAWPDPLVMSIDVRPDFSYLSHFPVVVVGPVAFGALACIVVWVLWSDKAKPPLRLTAYGLLWAMGLFLVELSSVRFQEPIVLYRSYIWAPGFLLASAGLVSLVPARFAMTVATAAVIVLCPLTWGRLATFSDELALWEDAVLKLSQPTSPGAVRIHYNRGIYRQSAGNVAGALEDFEWVIRQDPQMYQGYWARSSVRLTQNDLAAAVDDLHTVIRLKPELGRAYFQLGFVLSQLGRLDESETAFLSAQARGMPRIKFE